MEDSEDNQNKCIPPTISTTSDLGSALLQEGYSVNGDAIDRYEAFAWIIIENRPGLLRDILKDGVDPKVKTGIFETTGLHLAATVGSCEMITMLRNANADLEQYDKNDSTPLFIACHSGKTEAVELLCDFGANIKCRGKRGLSVLHGAANGGHCEIIQAMVAKGVDINCLNDYEKTPLIEAIEQGKLDALQRLVDLGAGSNLPDNNNICPLHYAAWFNHHCVIVITSGLEVSLRVLNFSCSPNNLLHQLDRGIQAAGLTNTLAGPVSHGSNLPIRRRLSTSKQGMA